MTKTLAWSEVSNLPTLQSTQPEVKRIDGLTTAQQGGGPRIQL